MEERNANLERDVRRYEERRALERRVCICDRAWASPIADSSL